MVTCKGTVFKRTVDGKIRSPGSCAWHHWTPGTWRKALFYQTIELKQSNKSLEEYAYVASHDLKEPLRKISTFGDRLFTTSQAALDTEGRNYLEKIISSSKRMQQMINDLLSVSMITGNKEFEVFSLKTILDDVIQTLEYKIEENQAVIQTDHLPEAYIVPSQFRQLFQNLLSNSLKFIQPGTIPRITVTHQYISPSDVKSLNLSKSGKYLQYISRHGMDLKNNSPKRSLPYFRDFTVAVITRVQESAWRYAGELPKTMVERSLLVANLTMDLFLLSLSPIYYEFKKPDRNRRWRCRWQKPYKRCVWRTQCQPGYCDVRKCRPSSRVFESSRWTWFPFSNTSWPEYAWKGRTGSLRRNKKDNRFHINHVVFSTSSWTRIGSSLWTWSKLFSNQPSSYRDDLLTDAIVNFGFLTRVFGHLWFFNLKSWNGNVKTWDVNRKCERSEFLTQAMSIIYMAFSTTPLKIAQYSLMLFRLTSSHVSRLTFTFRVSRSLTQATCEAYTLCLTVLLPGVYSGSVLERSTAAILLSENNMREVDVIVKPKIHGDKQNIPEARSIPNVS